MNIALLGYGKMGKEIEQVALSRKHNIALKVDEHNANSYTVAELKKADVAIEFSTPHSAFGNIMKCFEAGVPVVVGTTGWIDKMEEVKKACAEKKQGFFYASNYSVGVNIFFKLNEYLAKIMNSYGDYSIGVEEIHHVHKLDAPSGTAISIAKGIIDNIDRKDIWVNHKTEKQQELEIISLRTDEVPGTHTVSYSSGVDNIAISHVAHNRKGFALGAVLAAEFMKGKTGVYGMNELLAL